MGRTAELSLVELGLLVGRARSIEGEVVLEEVLLKRRIHLRHRE
jgi:hypothetical protein